MGKKAAAAKTLRLTQVRSSAKRLQAHKDTLRGLGIRRMHHSVERVATPEVLGMINAVSYMLKVEEV